MASSSSSPATTAKKMRIMLVAHAIPLYVLLYHLPAAAIPTTCAFQSTRIIHRIRPSSRTMNGRRRSSSNLVSFLPRYNTTPTTSTCRQPCSSSSSSTSWSHYASSPPSTTATTSDTSSNNLQSETSNRLLTRDQEEFFDSLDENIYGYPFVEKLRDLQDYKNRYGTCRVPKRYPENPSLGNWVNKSRQLYRKYLQGENTSMTKERVEILNKMGFLWSGNTASSHPKNHNNVHDANHKNDDNHENHHTHHDDDNDAMHTVQHVKSDSWHDNYQTLIKQIQLTQTHQDTTYGQNGSKTSPRNTKLGVWAANQRREYQKWQRGEKTSITKDKIDLLNEIGFDWNPWETKWKTRIRQLKEYYKEHGHCMVPVNYEKNPKLGRWVATQRKYYKMYKNGKTSCISKERIKELTEIGFVWNRWEDVWMERGDDNRLSSTTQRKL
jgi:Helicase associated domain.